MEEYYNTNKKRWNELVDIHAKSEEYDLEGFLEGKNSLHRLEMDLLGNINDKDILHLQCHFGLDTLSIARLGANVTGVDFSETAIELAQTIADRIGVKAKFICGNLFELPKLLDGEYDIVFTSYGVLCWLHDIRKWAKIISHYLKPGGLFLLIESHPFMWIFDEESEGLEVKYSYWHEESPLSWELDGTYADENAKLVNKKSYEWQHTVSDVLNSLIDAGLMISYIGEYPHLVWRYLYIAEKINETYYRIPGVPLPQTWSVKAIKPNFEKT
jgi:2-polyprenyl-3-methyl-5-hydroxy-6-metoxy-1,4-benzoquinol methylase